MLLAIYELQATIHKLKDLKEIGSKDIQSKYHEFASIMRRYNVSGRENAFDKLVNLFLCKVVDEYENPDDLGAAGAGLIILYLLPQPLCCLGQKN